MSSRRAIRRRRSRRGAVRHSWAAIPDTRLARDGPFTSSTRSERTSHVRAPSRISRSSPLSTRRRTVRSFSPRSRAASAVLTRRMSFSIMRTPIGATTDTVRLFTYKTGNVRVFGSAGRGGVDTGQLRRDRCARSARRCALQDRQPSVGDRQSTRDTESVSRSGNRDRPVDVVRPARAHKEGTRAALLRVRLWNGVTREGDAEASVPRQLARGSGSSPSRWGFPRGRAAGAPGTASRKN